MALLAPNNQALIISVRSSRGKAKVEVKREKACWVVWCPGQLSMVMGMQCKHNKTMVYAAYAGYHRLRHRDRIHGKSSLG